MRSGSIRRHLCAIALVATLSRLSPVQAQAPGAANVNGDPAGFAGTPISAPVDQSLQQTLDEVALKRSKDFMEKMSPAPAAKAPAGGASGLLVAPNTRFLFGQAEDAGAAQGRQAPEEALKPEGKPRTEPQAQGDASASQPKVKFSFKNADAAVVIEFVAKLLGLSPVIAPDLNQQLTVSTPGEVSPEEAYAILSAALDNLSYATVRTEKFLRVVRKKDAPQSPLKIYYGANPADLPDTDEMVTQLIPCKNVQARELMKYVAPLSSQDPAAGNISADPASNLLIVSDTASNVKRMLQLTQFLDVPGRHQFCDLVTTVYHINYLKAKDLAETLNNTFKIKPALSVKDDSVSGSQIVIQPHLENNTLLVTATPDLQKTVGATIRELDKRKKQVLLTVRFLESTDDRTFGSGTDFKYSNGSNSITAGPAPANNILHDTTKAPQLNYLFRNDNVELAVQALVEKNKIRILSQPRVLTADNETAALTIGKQRPILKSTTTMSTTTNNVVSDFSYIDIGIALSITPHINPENDVTLNMDMKLSSILEDVSLPSGTGNVNIPELANREIKTALTVRHAHTLAICGIISKDYKNEQWTLPELGDIPWIGWMFGQSQEQRSQTELIILITPVVVDNVEAEDKLTADERNELNPGGEGDFKDFKRFFVDKPKWPAEEKPAEGMPAGEQPQGGATEPDKAAEEPKREPSFFESLFQ